jgi:phosphatidylglycerophosphate synthase
MPEPALLIDARSRGPDGPLAAERVLGATVLDQAVALALLLRPSPLVVHARADEFDALARLLPEGRRDACRFVTGPPPAGAAVLRTDRLYDPARLRRAIRSGRDPETAVLWRLDTPHGLRGADEELARRRHFQPLGRLWATALARGLATALAPTAVRPNHLTLVAGALMLAGAGLVAFAPASMSFRLLTAACLALALVLDTADGHLARLQGTAGAFGRWLDANLDELADMALHAAVAWSLYARSGHVGWLLAGMAYGMGKYMFLVGQHTWTSPAERPAAAPTGVPALAGLSWPRRVAHWTGHADVRWHAWIALAAAGRLEWELIAFVAYFPLRALAGAYRKGAAHA